MINFEKLSPMLYSEDVNATVDFYTQKLGFDCGNYSEEWQWAALRRDSVEIMVSYPNEHVPFVAPKFTGSFYIQTENVDELWEEIKDKVNVCYPIEDFDYGMREFAIFDNNGYLLQFGSQTP